MRYAGIDEVGLGSLAGPLVVACVAIDADVPLSNLREWWPLRGVRDSKKTSASQRDFLVPRIADMLLRGRGSLGFGEVSADYINRVGYSAALEEAKVRAVREVLDDERPDFLIVDGAIGLPAARVAYIEQRALPRADADYWVVAAASIMAKHRRDRTMVELSEDFPEYGWAQNMGYTGGDKKTSPHVVALRRYGLTPHHRTRACATVLA